ncbi:MAG: helix-turn-helix domain-containing protein [Vibrio sp.]|uniref:helix-turn-helix domain-containing protein n=1 Tax=Vibrio sp. TaxID=678 RepID=UPI003A839E06
MQDITCAPSLEDVSREFGRSKETLIRIFKKHLGITPKSFLNNSRVEKAKILLKRFRYGSELRRSLPLQYDFIT